MEFFKFNRAPKAETKAEIEPEMEKFSVPERPEFSLHWVVDPILAKNITIYLGEMQSPERNTEGHIERLGMDTNDLVFTLDERDQAHAIYEEAKQKLQEFITSGSNQSIPEQMDEFFKSKEQSA